MKIFPTKTVSFKDLLATIWPIILITAIGIYIAYQFVQPAPPKKMTISAGNESGAYYAYAKRYAELLNANGITLEIKTSAGSRQNLERLKNDEADIAFVQGGMDDSELTELADSETSLRSLGSVAYEPVWIFYRGEQRLDKLFMLQEMKVSIGEPGSGIRSLALKLLQANGVPVDSPNLLSMDEKSTAEAMQNGTIDAAFVVAAPEAGSVQNLLNAAGIRVMSLVQADAYLRRYPFLSKVILPRGVIDLVKDLPPRDTSLLTTTANVVIRSDLHPALASLMLQAMSEVHGKSGFFHHAGDFPAYKDQSFPLADDAQRYYKSGPPFLQRYLPFWIAVLVERMIVLIVPIIVLLLPLLKIAPGIYSWRVRSKIFRCYGDLKFLENELREHYDPLKKSEYLSRLNRIEDDAYYKNIPLGFTDLLYTLRTHINLIREKLIRLDTEKQDTGG